MKSNSFEFTFQENQSRSWWKSPVIWSALILGAFLVYEITAKPVLGLVLLCSKFGWDDFLTAYWLRLVDPNHPRGKVFFWFHSAMGMFKIAGAGALLSFLLCFVFVLFKAHNRAIQFPPEILTGLGVYFFGLIICPMPLLIGFCQAFSRRVRVWLPSTTNGKENLAGPLLQITVFVIWFGCFEVIGMFAVAAERRGIKVPSAEIWIVAMIVIGMTLFRLFPFLKKRLIAQDPNQCWDSDAVGSVMLSGLPNWRKWRVLAALHRDAQDLNRFQQLSHEI
jgi:hypothetical protein